MIANWNDASLAVAGVLGVLGIVVAAGLVAGQFRKGLVAELRNSLDTANTELSIERGRSDRLEEAVRALEIRITAMESENRVLRETLQTGIKLAPEFQTVMIAAADALAKKTEATADALALKTDASFTRLEENITRILHEGWRDRDRQEHQALMDFEARIIERHDRFTNALPPKVGKALKGAIH